jgi:hypothetical protein
MRQQDAPHAGIAVCFFALKDTHGLKCQAAFIGQPLKASASQQQLSDTLLGMGLLVEDEFPCPKSDYSNDMRVHVACP